MATNQFPNSLTSFKDTLGRGKISVQGFIIEADEDGFIECPAHLAPEIAPHGFLPQARPAKQTLGLPQAKR